MATMQKGPAGAATPARAGNVGKLEYADFTISARPFETLALRRWKAEGGAE